MFLRSIVFSDSQATLPYYILVKKQSWIKNLICACKCWFIWRNCTMPPTLSSLFWIKQWSKSRTAYLCYLLQRSDISYS